MVMVWHFSCTNVFTLGSPGLWVSKQVGCFNLLADLWFWSGTDRLPRHPVVPDDPGGGNAVLPSPGDPDGCSTVHSSHWHLVGRMHHCRAPGSTRSLPSQQPSTAGILSTFLAPLYPLPRPHLIAVFQMFSSIFFCTFFYRRKLLDGLSCNQRFQSRHTTYSTIFFSFYFISLHGHVLNGRHFIEVVIFRSRFANLWSYLVHIWGVRALALPPHSAAW